MRYDLDSMLPDRAFQPRGKGPFARGMTLEGGKGAAAARLLPLILILVLLSKKWLKFLENILSLGKLKFGQK